MLPNPKEGVVPNPVVDEAAGVSPAPKAKVVAGVVGAGLATVDSLELPNPAGVDPKAEGVDPAPNIKPLTEEAEPLADGAGVNDDGAPVPNENVAPPEVDGAWEADDPNENGAAGVIALAPS